MKIQMTKHYGGALAPYDEMEAEKLSKFKSNELYEIDIKRTRNPQFHRKVFSFFKFCFEYWRGDREFMDESGQFDVFRSELTVNAGYYDAYYKFDGSVRIEAKSLSYSSMSPEDFEKCYLALTNAAMKHIFKGCDENTYQQLLSFF